MLCIVLHFIQETHLCRVVTAAVFQATASQVTGRHEHMNSTVPELRHYRHYGSTILYFSISPISEKPHRQICL